MLFDQDLQLSEHLAGDDLTVTLLDERVRYNIRLKTADITLFNKASGLKLPRKINTSSVAKDSVCLCLGPDEWVVIADPKLKKKLDTAFAKVSKISICSITDISHRNVAFEISGTRAALLINAGCPLDLALSQFPVGKASRTVFESAAIMLLRTDEFTFTIECWRSFGPYLRDYFTRIVTTNNA